MTIVCPTPIATTDRVQLGHGSGGKMSAALLRDRFLPAFRNDILAQLGDAAIVDIGGQSLAISTDTFVVQPLEFPGGNIGSLAVHGTVNDLAMMGAEPRWLSAGFVLEEGLATPRLSSAARPTAFSSIRQAWACGTPISLQPPPARRLATPSSSAARSDGMASPS
jgi:hydrogenase expression/formation protein HypE